MTYYTNRKEVTNMDLNDLLANWDAGGCDAETVCRALLAAANLPHDDDAVRVALAVQFSRVLAPMDA